MGKWIIIVDGEDEGRGRQEEEKQSSSQQFQLSHASCNAPSNTKMSAIVTARYRYQSIDQEPETSDHIDW